MITIPVLSWKLNSIISTLSYATYIWVGVYINEQKPKNAICASIKTSIIKTHNCTLFILYLLVAIKKSFVAVRKQRVVTITSISNVKSCGKSKKIATQNKKMLHLKKAE